eukprot:COSAG05_NODE_174_length_14944_cov_32.054092_14_plen_44_part_00
MCPDVNTKLYSADQSQSDICVVLQVGKMVVLTAARGMHEFFQI